MRFSVDGEYVENDAVANHLLLLFEFYILKVTNLLIAELIWAGCTIYILIYWAKSDFHTAAK